MGVKNVERQNVTRVTWPLEYRSLDIFCAVYNTR